MSVITKQMPSNTLVERLNAVRQRIAQSASSAQNATPITLLAVSKTQPPSAIEKAIHAGQYCFGENYLQEALDKIAYFTDHPTEHSLEWHFIGPIQSNKTKRIAQAFDWVQTIDRLKIAERLNADRPSDRAPLNYLIQVNLDDEASKAGIAPRELLSFAESLQPFHRLKLRGLMFIPKATSDRAEQRQTFQAGKALFDQLQAIYPHVDTLSMGMSHDLEAAIEAGATLVRIGEAIFGPRIR